MGRGVFQLMSRNETRAGRGGMQSQFTRTLKHRDTPIKIWVTPKNK